MHREGLDSPTEPPENRAVLAIGTVIRWRDFLDCSAGAHEEFSPSNATNQKETSHSDRFAKLSER